MGDLKIVEVLDNEAARNMQGHRFGPIVGSLTSSFVNHPRQAPYEWTLLDFGCVPLLGPSALGIASAVPSHPEEETPPCLTPREGNFEQRCV